MGHTRACWVIFVLAGCRPPSLVAQPNVPTLSAEGQRCRNAVGLDQPLVTEWPASEKSNLESQVRMGGVVVSFTGCQMTVLTGCRTREPYHWVRTTPSSDWIEIKNEDELYAKLPLGAASLKGELQGSGRLTMQTTITGQFVLGVPKGTMPSIEGDCQGATHIVGGLAIGAYQLDAGGTARANVEAQAAVMGNAGAKSTASKSIIRRSGDTAACANSTDQYPDANCSSPIQTFLLAVRPAGPPAGGGFAMGRPMGAPAGGPIEVQIVSAEPEATWDVVLDGRKVCTTPCSQRIDPSRTLLMREQTGVFSRTSRVKVGSLEKWAHVGGVQVKAHSTSTWNLAGLTRIGGIFYGVIGAGFMIPCLTMDDDPDDRLSRRDSLCTMGGISLGLGVALFVAGTYLMDSPGKADTSPLTGTF